MKGAKHAEINNNQETGPGTDEIPKPEYEVEELEGARGWCIRIKARHVAYRIVSGYEQVAEPTSDYLYLSVLVKGCRSIGFRFKGASPWVEHTRDRKRGWACIMLWTRNDRLDQEEWLVRTNKI